MKVITKKKIKDFSNELFCNNHLNYEDVNSLGFRSDEFTNVHHGKHIVFSGCSNTFGIGLEKKEIWAYKVYEKISNNEKCSGFFNLGVGGSGIDHMTINLFRYFKQYGNPDVIFINLSNQLRSFEYKNDLNGYVLKLDDVEEYKKVCFLNFQYYFMLEQYCRSNNIKLLSFTWDYIYKNLNFEIIKEKDIDKNKSILPTNELFKNYNFETFYEVDFKKMIKETAILKFNNKSKYFHVARDGEHPGTGMQLWWSNFIYEKYLGLL